MPSRGGTRQRAAGESRRLALALQGGGAHGAFTWGVLDRLLENNSRTIDAISGTSAGAINAAIFAAGYLDGGAGGARDRLDRFWHKLADLARLNPLQPTPFEIMALGRNIELSFAHVLRDVMLQMFSPYQLNPLDIHPLRDILNDLIDFEGLRAHPEIKLFVAATNVRTCKLKVFCTPEITVDSLLASACLPTLFRAVEINGESYWDGGYLANPAISPLIHECVSKDVIIVQINPMNRPDVPGTAREILDRLNEISFNSCLVREMNGIATVSRLLEEGRPGGHELASVKFHMIEAEAEISKLGSSSKFNADWAFLTHLHDLGMEATDRWLAEHFDAIGNTSTLDMIKTYE